MGERKICYRCMKRYDSNLSICPLCAYAENTPSNPAYLIPGTMLHERYLIGVLLGYNGEGATYTAHDTSTECTVLIREYMPVNLCTRSENKKNLNVNYESLAKYKAFMAEFTELNKSLAHLRNNSNINAMLDMFNDNNTTYAVFEHIEGVSMLDYLKDNAGELSWEQISKLFPPLFTTLGILHNAGIIHRAICPETVFITNKGELKLTGFCISSVRTADSGLEYELFRGYTAPEQYSAGTNSRQGSWTDVYGVCALMYRSLTGCMPVDAMRRLKEDELCEPRMLSAKIPRNVSKIIMDGMNLSGCDRIQTITELVTKLFEQPVTKNTQNTATKNTTPEKSKPRKQDKPKDKPREKQNNPEVYDNNSYYEPVGNENTGYRYETVDRLKVPVIIGVLLIAILMIIAVFIVNMITDTRTDRQRNSELRQQNTTVSDNVVSGDTEEETEEITEEFPDTLMPDLVGKFYELSMEKYKDFFNLVPEYEYNDDYEADKIFWQNIEPGAQLIGGRATIEVKVSKGKENAIIPEFKDVEIKDYQAKLKKAGISNYSILATKSDKKVNPNVVIGLQVEGKDVKAGDTFSNKDGKKLIVYYYSESVSTNSENLYISNPPVQDYETSESYDEPEQVTTQEYTTEQSYDYEETTEKTTKKTVSQWVEPQYTEPYTDPPVTTQAQSAETEPVYTNPPETQAPVVTDPPIVVTDPPATQEPVITDPPVVVTDPPVVQEPVYTDPPAVTEPPPVVDEPQIDLSGGDDPGVI
ncbi:MAG: protein kinase [Ruminococcus sp.]|nr:protein kinase [Ruminococcus sp.]